MSWTCLLGEIAEGTESSYPPQSYVQGRRELTVNPYKPLGCLCNQFSLSRGDMVLQLAGFGMGEAAACSDVNSGCGGCVGVEADCAFLWCWIQRFSWLFGMVSALGGSGIGWW